MKQLKYLCYFNMYVAVYLLVVVAAVVVLAVSAVRMSTCYKNNCRAHGYYILTCLLQVNFLRKYHRKKSWERR